MPLENSTKGAVNSTLDALQNTTKNLWRVGNAYKAFFISQTEEIEKIKNIYGHQQSLAQCKKNSKPVAG